MSPASYLAAPPRAVGADCSSVVTLFCVWNWAIYGALIASAVAVTAALALLVVRLLQGWRDVKRFRRHLFRDLDRLFARVETFAEKAMAAADTSRLEASIAKLRNSLARLTVLRDAFDEATAFTALIPRK